MRVYNTITRTKEEFQPRDPGKVAMYVCGPTVYNHIHIGNARTFLTFDMIRRYLEWRDFEVTFIQNITDVDDKIIKQSIEEGVPASQVAAVYADEFLKIMGEMGVEPATRAPRATEEIGPMIDMIERLIARGHAYEAEGDVYFAVRSFPGYGKLSGRDIDELEVGARVEVGDRKRDPLDFALWKAAKPGEPEWDSPWGSGRPGWHLECSVMSEKELGLPFDIHGGATDLVFPHHENELAQSEAATGGTFVNYWVHGGLLQINQEKMSKSLGNFLLLRDVLDHFSPSTIRLLMLQTHYRSPLDFSDDRLAEAQSALDRLDTAVRNARWAIGLPSGAGVDPGAVAELIEAIAATRSRFVTEMDDDFNTAGALAGVFDLARALNGFVSEHQAALGHGDKEAVTAAAETIAELLAVLGVEVGADEAATWPHEVVDLARTVAGYHGDDPTAAVSALLSARADARAEKDWATADAVRDGLAELGFTIEDTPQGARVDYRSKG
jgi:cysteinyl-tRNA synthetase